MKTVKKITLWILAIGIAFLIANFTGIKTQTANKIVPTQNMIK